MSAQPLRSVNQLWRSLTAKERDRIAAELADLKDGAAWSSRLDAYVTHALNFRAATLERAAGAHLVRLILRAAPRMTEEDLRDLLVTLHVEARPEFLLAVYQAMGVETDTVALTPELREKALSPVPICAALPSLRALYPVEDLTFCFELMRFAAQPGWQPAVEAALEALHGRTPARPETPAISPEPEARAEASEEEATQQEGIVHPGFTTLDKVLIRAIVSSVNHTQGSLPLDDLDDLVHELAQLNESRAQSRFHRGFLDALLDLDAQPLGAGENRDRRAWYLAGYFLGRMRQDPDIEIEHRLRMLEPGDKQILVEDGGAPGAVMLAAQVVPILLRSADVGEALPWLRAYLPVHPLPLLSAVEAWSKEGLVQGDPATVRLVLEVVVRELDQVPAVTEALPTILVQGVRRRLAIAWRCEGRAEQANAMLDKLLEESDTAEQRAYLLGHRALTQMGVTSVGTFALPGPATRATFLAGMEAVRPDLVAAAANGRPFPAALMALALPAVADVNATKATRVEACERLRRAIDTMQTEDADFWERMGALARCRFYLSVLELRAVDPRQASVAVARLCSLLASGFEAPLDLLQDAVTNAVLQDAPRSAELGGLVLADRAEQMLTCLDMRALSKRSAPLRGALVEALQRAAPNLSPKEQWTAWHAIARGALEAEVRGVEHAETALDALETLAEEEGLSERLLHLLATPGDWAPAWTHRECEEARVRLLERTGRLDTARAALGGIVHSAITDQDADVDDLIEKFRALGATSDEMATLERRRPPRDPAQAGIAGVTTPAQSPARVHVLFIGGHETQEAYHVQVREAFRARYPNGHLEFRTPGWGANWNRLLKRMKGRLESADAVVLMRFVRTQLGRTVRKIASERDIPWIPCTGHGRDSVLGAILYAADLVTSRQSES